MSSSEEEFVVTLIGHNDAPGFLAPFDAIPVAEWANGSAEEAADATHVFDSDFFFADVDLSDVHAISVTPIGQALLGEVSASVVDQPNHVGHFHFEVADSAIDGLRAGETLEQQYTLTVTDNHGGSATQTVTIELQGASDAEPPAKAFFTGEEDVPLDGKEGLFAGTPLTTLVDVTPFDGDRVPAGVPIELDIGTLTVNADGSFVLTPNAASQGNCEHAEWDADFTYNAIGADGPVSGSFNIAIAGKNDAPEIEQADTAATVSAGGASTADRGVSFSDPDWGDGHSAYFYPAEGGYLGEFSASVTDEPSAGSAGALAWRFSVDPDALAALAPGESRAQTYTIVLRDSELASVQQQVTVTLEGPPAAQVVALDDVVLTNAALGSPIAIPEWALVGNDTSTAGPVTQIGAVRDATGGTFAGFTPTQATDDPVGFTLTTAAGGGFSYDATAGGGTDAAHVAVLRVASGSGTADADILVGGPGNDRLNGGDGNDILIGGDGNDMLLGDNGDDRVSGGSGDDTITEWYGTHTIVDAGEGNDTINILADGTMHGPVEGGAGRELALRQRSRHHRSRPERDRGAAGEQRPGHRNGGPARELRDHLAIAGPRGRLDLAAARGCGRLRSPGAASSAPAPAARPSCATRPSPRRRPATPSAAASATTPSPAGPGRTCSAATPEPTA